MRVTVSSFFTTAFAIPLATVCWPNPSRLLAPRDTRAQPPETPAHIVLQPHTNGFSDDAVLEKRTMAKLEEHVSVDFSNRPLSEFIRYLGSSLDIHFFLDRRALLEADISPEEDLSVQLQNVPANTMLELALSCWT